VPRRTPVHKIGRHLTNARAIRHQQEVIGFRMLSAQFKAVLIDHVFAQAVAFFACFDAVA
jgi:hypothetical protein